MSRSAEEVLEFDQLRELLRLRCTCPLGRRAVDALAFTLDRGALEQEFALVREARAWLRAGRDLGFGALSDPQSWLGLLEGPGAVLEPGSADIDVAALHHGYLRQAKSRQATVLLDCAIAGLHFAGGR